MYDITIIDREVFHMENKVFNYSYSQDSTDEVRNIREKYIPKSSKKKSQLEQLRELDSKAERRGRLLSLSVGIIFCLILGAGMSLCLMYQLYLPGIILGLIGMAGIIAAYPIFKSVTESDRAKVASRIMELSSEILGE